MARVKIVISILIASIALVACGELPQSSMQTVTPYPPGINQQQVDAYVAQAQLAQSTAASAGLTATYQSVRATQQIQNVTHAAMAAETGTAASINHSATETAVSIFAAREENNQLGTSIALQATGTSMSINSQQQATIAVASANGTAQAIQDAQDYQQAMANLSERRLEMQMESERQRQVRANILTVVFSIIVLFATAGVIFSFVNRGRVQVARHGDTVSYFVHTSTGLRPALPSRTLTSGNSMLALPPPRSTVVVGESTPDNKASWARFSEWDDLRHLPIGASNNGPIMIDTAREPHVMIAGYTGTGKTRRILWPIVSAALAGGSHVMLVNERGSDFKPFRSHPNVTIVRGNRKDMPKLAARVLSAAVKEVDRRDAVLNAHGISTWDRLPPGVDNGSEVVIVIDEFLALARSRIIDPGMQKIMMESAIVLTSEARKFGIRLLITVTSPGRRALGDAGLTIRDQCARVALALKDRATSLAFMGDSSAMGLDEGHFIANVSGRIHKGVAFCPSDRDIEIYLLSHRVDKSDLPENIASFSIRDPIEDINEDDPLSHSKAREILLYWETTGRRPSKRAIEHAVFGYMGGNAHQIVKAVINAYEDKYAPAEGVLA